MLFKPEHYIPKWVERFQLQNWEINFKYVSPKEMESVIKQDVEACVIMDYFKNKATLYFLKSAKTDPEEMVIHELLHIVLAHEKLESMTIFNEICSPELMGIISQLLTNKTERVLHQITSALLNRRC